MHNQNRPVLTHCKVGVSVLVSKNYVYDKEIQLVVNKRKKNEIINKFNLLTKKFQLGPGCFRKLISCYI